MRKSLMLVLFALGCIALMPRSGFSVENCSYCQCREMKAWVMAKNDGPEKRARGLRGPDPTDPMNKTIPIPHAVRTTNYGFLYAAVCDTGSHKYQRKEYNLYYYTKEPTLPCLVKGTPHPDSLLEATFPNAADWDEFTGPPGGIAVMVEWIKCDSRALPPK
jgi:hypothetical protein